MSTWENRSDLDAPLFAAKERPVRGPLVVRLKSVEYDGNDIMQAWLQLEARQARIQELEKIISWHIAAHAYNDEACDFSDLQLVLKSTETP